MGKEVEAMTPDEVHKVLTIAGSDSGGGAGIQADLKTFAALGVYGTSVITAVTAQNTLGVQGVGGIDPALVEQQMDSVFLDIKVEAAKTGMLYDEGIIRAVARKLGEHRVRNVVVDPVMVSTTGHRLLLPEAERAMRELMMPAADFVTPNPDEASVLWGASIRKEADLHQAARAIRDMGARFVIITGVKRGERCLDLAFDGREFRELEGPYIPTPNTHGTGCTYSAALASFLAYGMEPWEAAQAAKDFVTTGLRYSYSPGKGSGPVNHSALYYPGTVADRAVARLRSLVFANWRKRPEPGREPVLNLIIGSPWCSGQDYAELAEKAIRMGTRVIQLREKEKDSREMIEVGLRVARSCREHGAIFIVNDRADVAVAVGADGVHLGQTDIPPEVARAMMGPGKIVGVSVSTVEEARAAIAAGADYLGLGPVFATASKQDAAPPCGLETVRQVASFSPVPVIAIGGITPENAREVLNAGAAGVAVISAVWDSPDPWDQMRRFIEMMRI
ncbi:bifunctional hydroxymethylpyrimidine kinase/phosphomethylpyrimidine kinase [Syntrophothermus lipocalidus]|nr:bifunctional hydroxymethylpyrimidine kinase/phosphomethylpyrimidine kinase [Syntrophothermus lipocalidus]